MLLPLVHHDHVKDDGEDEDGSDQDCGESGDSISGTLDFQGARE